MLLGTIARHLPPSDPKRASALDLLLGVLGTPSESVQRSVSNCLPPLVAPLAANAEYTQVRGRRCGRFLCVVCVWRRGCGVACVCPLRRPPWCLLAHAFPNPPNPPCTHIPPYRLPLS